MKHRLSLAAAALSLSVLALSSSSCKSPGGAASPAPTAHSADHEKPSVPAAAAKQRLVAGNRRFASGKSVHPHQDTARRNELADIHQRPFAIVVGCADSRTGPEVIFDQGLGDLFVIRVAGNVVNDELIGSIEYAVAKTGAKLIVVLGHENCGAIAASRDAIAKHEKGPGHIQSLVEAIEPAVKSTLGESERATTEANVRNVVRQLQTCGPILNKAVSESGLEVKGGYYDLHSGRVAFLD